MVPTTRLSFECDVGVFWRYRADFVEELSVPFVDEVSHLAVFSRWCSVASRPSGAQREQANRGGWRQSWLIGWSIWRPQHAEEGISLEKISINARLLSLHPLKTAMTLLWLLTWIMMHSQGHSIRATSLFYGTHIPSIMSKTFILCNFTDLNLLEITSNHAYTTLFCLSTAHWLWVYKLPVLPAERLWPLRWIMMTFRRPLIRSHILLPWNAYPLYCVQDVHSSQLHWSQVIGDYCSSNHA